MKTFFLLICFCVLTVMLQAQQLSSKCIAVIEKQIDSAFADNLKAGEAFNMDKLAQSVDDSRRTGFIMGGGYYSTFDSLMVFVKKAGTQVIRQEYSLTNKKISVLSENVALVTACGSSTVFTTSGGAFSLKFSWTFVYEMVNGKWKVIHSHQSGGR